MSAGAVVAASWALWTADAALAGYRAAAGRNGLVRKRSFYARAVLRGVVAGQVVALLVAGAAALYPAGMRPDLLAVARAILQVGLPVAAIVLGGLALRLVPSVDLRSMTSVALFAPLTLLRPVVLVLALAWGVRAAGNLAVVPLALLILVAALSLERALLSRTARAAARRPAATRSR